MKIRINRQTEKELGKLIIKAGEIGWDKYKKLKEQKETEKRLKREKISADKDSSVFLANKTDRYILYLKQKIKNHKMPIEEYNLEKLYNSIVYNHCLLLYHKNYEKKLKQPDIISFRLVNILSELIIDYCKKQNISQDVANSIDFIRWHQETKKNSGLKRNFTVMRNINMILENVSNDDELTFNSVSFEFEAVKKGLDYVLAESQRFVSKYSDDDVDEEFKEMLRDFVLFNNIILKFEFETF